MMMSDHTVDCCRNVFLWSWLIIFLWGRFVFIFFGLLCALVIRIVLLPLLRLLPLLFFLLFGWITTLPGIIIYLSWCFLCMAIIMNEIGKYHNNNALGTAMM